MLITDYSFDVSAKTITLPGQNLAAERIMSIVNRTREVFYFRVGDSTKAISVAFDGTDTVISLNEDLSYVSHADTDLIQIIVTDTANLSDLIVGGELKVVDDGVAAIGDLIPEFLFVDGKLFVTTDLDLSGLATKAKQDDLIAKLPDGLTVIDGKLQTKPDIQFPSSYELGETSLAALENITAEIDKTGLATEAKQDDLLAKIPNQINNRIPVDIGGDGSITITSGTITVANTVEITNEEGDPIPVEGTVTLTSESGFLPYRNTALSSTAQSIKNSAGSLMGWNAINPNTVPVYLKFYNNATPTVGTTTPLLTIMIPPGDGSTPGMFLQEPSIVPLEIFSTAISVACVTGLADSSTTAPSTAIHFSARYK